MDYKTTMQQVRFLVNTETKFGQRTTDENITVLKQSKQGIVVA